MNKKLLAYNRAVLNRVRELDSIAGDTLSAEGSARGWWNNIHYWYTVHWTVEQAAQHIVRLSVDTDWI
jgi:hypothetical protein